MCTDVKKRENRLCQFLVKEDENVDNFTIALRIALRGGNIQLTNRIRRMTTWSEQTIKENIAQSQDYHPEQSLVLWGVQNFEPRPLVDDLFSR